MAQIKLLSIVNGRPTGHAAADSQVTISGLTLNGGGAEVTNIDNDLSSIIDSHAALASAKAIKDYVDARAAATITLADSADTTSYVVIADDATGDLAPKSDAGLTYNAGTGMLTATGLTGPLTGNAATATKIASITNSDIVQLTETQTLTNKTLTAPTLTTPALGTPASGVLTNCTALPAAQVAQGTMASGMVLVAPALGTPASGVLTNCTALPAAQVAQGTMASGMVLVAPALGTPASGVATNLTGTAASLTAGNATTLATARNINGVSFNGSANITVPAAGSTLTDAVPLGKGGTGATTAAGAAAALLNIDMGGGFQIGNQSNDLCTFGGPVTVTGNLTVSGTTTTVSSTVLTVADPLIEMGADTDDSKDRGMVMLYNDGASKKAWMGWDESVNKFAMLSAATDTSQVMSGTKGVLVADLDGDATGSSGSCTGNAATASALASAGTITFTGDVVGGSTPTYTGGGNLSIAMAIQANSVALATDTTGDYVQNITAGTGLTSTGATSGENIGHSLSVDASQTQITAVGALNGGSITSGFGTINTGASNITTSGTVAMGVLSDGGLTIAAGDITASNSIQRIVAGEALKAGEPVAVASDGKVYVADKGETNLAAGSYDSVIGVVVGPDCAADGTALIQCGVGCSVEAPGALADMDEGKPVYLDAHEAVHNDGRTAYTQTAPTTGAVVVMGIATGDDDFIFTGGKVSFVN
jgi:hypothetical protein